MCSNMLTSSTLCVSQAVAAEARPQLSRLLVGHHDEPATVESQRGWRADRLIADLAAYLRRADAQGTLNIRAPTSSGGPIPVDVPRRWPHPRADDARHARRAGRQGAAAGSGAGVHGGLCESTLTEEDQGEMNSQASTGQSSS